MKLKEGETIIAEYDFGQVKRETGIRRLLLPVNKTTGIGIKSILTTNRLIFLSGSSEEHYPLSKITALKIEQSSISYTPLLTILIVLFLTITPIIYYIIFLRMTHERMSLNIDNVMIYYVIVLIVPFLFKMKQHFTSLVISQAGGEKWYKTKSSDKLQSFIEKVNETMD